MADDTNSLLYMHTRTRTARFVAALGSGYLSAVVLALCNLVSIPVALHVLSKEEFGTAAAVVQIAAFSGIFHLGVGPSVARFVTDWRTSSDEAGYASFLRTVWNLHFFQAAVLIIAGFALLKPIRALFDIPDALQPGFSILYTVSIGIAACATLLIPLNQILYSHQRIDLINFIGIAALLLQTVSLLISLISGFGLLSYGLSAVTGFLTSSLLTTFLIVRERLLPNLRLGRSSFSEGKKLLDFSWRVALVMIAQQFLVFAPALLVSRCFGIAALADWTVGTKLFQMMQQFVLRVPNASEPALWEMHALGERRGLELRLSQMVRLTCIFAAAFAGCLIIGNASFVSFWTGGSVVWNSMIDVGCAGLLICSALVQSLSIVPGLTKKIGSMGFVFMAEALLVAVLTALAPQLPSLVYVPFILLVPMLLFRGSYSVYRILSSSVVDAQALVSVLIRLVLVCSVVLCSSAFAVAYEPPSVSLYSLTTNMIIFGFLFTLFVFIFALTKAERAFMVNYVNQMFAKR